MSIHANSAAFFDLDKTIIVKSSTLAFAGRFTQAGLLSRRALLKAGIGQFYFSLFGADHSRMERIQRELTELSRGWDRSQIESIIAETVDEVVSPLVYAEALALIDDHKRAGRTVFLVSSGPEEVVKPLGGFLDIDQLICTRPEIDRQGRYTGELLFYAYGDSKAAAIRSKAAQLNLSLADSFAYSDSITDLPMLEAVGHPVAVNPDKELAAEAERRDWQIMIFDRPVTLRTRLTSVSPPFPVVSGLVIGGLLLSSLLLWLLRWRKPSTT